MLGDVFAKKGDFKEAEQGYLKAIASREKYFTVDTTAIDKLKSKYNCVGEGMATNLPFPEMWQ